MKRIVKSLSVWCMLLAITACSTSPAPSTESEAPVSNPDGQIVVESGDLRMPDVEESTPITYVQTDLIPSQGLEFTSNNDGTCTIAGIGICQDPMLVIPTESPAGETVISIEEYAFMGLEDVDSVVLLNGTYEIGQGAFSYGEMNAIYILGGAPTIGDSSFSSCEDLEVIDFQNTVLQVGKNAFFGDGKDAAVTFSNCTGTLEKSSFPYSDLETLSIVDCDVTIEENAFSSCEKLTQITAQNSTILLEDSAFWGSGDAAEVSLTDCSVTMEDNVFSYGSLGSLTITGNTLELGKNAFSNCEDLSTVTIDCPSVTIDDNSFFGCSDLLIVSICENGRSDNDITLEDGVFQYCDILSSVIIGDGTVETGDYLFTGCPDALSVTINGQSYIAGN